MKKLPKEKPINIINKLKSINLTLKNEKIKYRFIKIRLFSQKRNQNQRQYSVLVKEKYKNIRVLIVAKRVAKEEPVLSSKAHKKVRVINIKMLRKNIKLKYKQ